MAERSNTKTMFAIHAALFVALMLSSTMSSATASSFPKLLLITFDGFGWNFLHKLPSSELPGFQNFIEKGVHVRWVENVFPSVTRTNHMSLVSGLYSESHGIVGNQFYDPNLDAVMPKPGQLKENDSMWVDVGAEPVWVTNSKAGNGRRSGTINWPCSDAKIKGRLPDEIRRGEWTVSEEQFSANQRIDLALDWLTGKTTKPVNFVAVYTMEPDGISHKWGPDSSQVLDAIRFRDGIVTHLLSELKKRNLEDELNVIITADHGQLRQYPEATINIDQMVDAAWYTLYPSWPSPVINMWPKQGYYEKLVNGLKGKHPNLFVATRSNSGELVKMHYLTSPRIADIVLYGEPGWAIVTNNMRHKLHNGSHGWDPRFSPQMWPFFIAKGPAFKQGVRNAEPFRLVDVYPLMCHILGLDPAPNNGSLSKAAHILSSQPGHANYTWVGIGLVVIILGLVIAVIAIRYIRYTKNVTASYKRTFARAGSTDNMVEDGMAILSDEEL